MFGHTARQFASATYDDPTIAIVGAISLSALTASITPSKRRPHTRSLMTFMRVIDTPCHRRATSTSSASLASGNHAKMASQIDGPSDDGAGSEERAHES